MIKTNALLIVMSITLLSVSAPACTRVQTNQVTGSATIQEYKLEVTDFSQLAVTGPIPVEIFQAKNCSVTLYVNDNFYQYVRVNQVVDLLRIDLEPISYKNLNISLRVGIPSLRTLAIARAGNCTVHAFNLKETCEITVSEASTADVNLVSEQYVSIFATSASSLTGTLVCSDARLAASGAGRLSLDGQCDYAFIDAAGASQVNLAGCWIGSAEAIVRGVSSAVLNVGGKLNIDVSGASTLSYGGNPNLGKVVVAAGSKLVRR